MLEANVLSESTKETPNARMSESVLSSLPQIATAATAWQKLLFGLFRLPNSVRRAGLEHYLFQDIAPAIDILPYGQAAAEWHASEQVRLSRIGRTPPLPTVR